MNSKIHNEDFLMDFVNCCINNIIKHELIKGVSDLKSFAEFALSLDLDDDRLFEGIAQGIVMTLPNLSLKETNTLRCICDNYSYNKEKTDMVGTRRLKTLEECYDYLIELVYSRIRQRLRQELS